MRIITSLIFLFIPLICFFSQKSENDFYASLKGKDSLVDYVLNNRDKFHLQFIVTDIERDNEGNEIFSSFDYSTDEYFYPASMVKLPTAIATLEWMDSLQLQKECIIKMNKDVTCGSHVFLDRIQKSNTSIKSQLEEMLSISDNYYYTLFFHFLTPLRLNRFLLNHNLGNTKIYSSFSGCPKGRSVETNSFSLHNPSGEIVYFQQKSFLDSSKYMHLLPFSKSKLVGNYIIENGKKIKKPYDFNYQLYYPLRDIHSTMLKLVFPQQVNPSERFLLSSESRNFLLKCLGNFPREMQNKVYHNSVKYPDNYFKYAIIGNRPQYSLNGRYRTFSKIGIAYGFVTESAYIVDFEQQKDFIVSVSLYVNSDEIVNDGIYEYEKIARPFIANFSRLIQNQLTKSNGRSPYTTEYFNMLKGIMIAN